GIDARPLFEQRDFDPGLRQAQRGRGRAKAGSDDEGVRLVSGHVAPLLVVAGGRQGRGQKDGRVLVTDLAAAVATGKPDEGTTRSVVVDPGVHGDLRE